MRNDEHLAEFISLIDQQQFPRTVHRQFRTTVLKTPLEELLMGTVCKNKSNCSETVTILLLFSSVLTVWLNCLQHQIVNSYIQAALAVEQIYAHMPELTSLAVFPTTTSNRYKGRLLWT